jgi:hypothetical protein
MVLLMQKVGAFLNGDKTAGGLDFAILLSY